MNIYNLESNVKSYCNSYPEEFFSASGCTVVDKNGKEYLDFLSGCGSLNYGHNHPKLKIALMKYIDSNGIAMSMDLHTVAKSEFIKTFTSYILQPRKLDYLLQFTNPTGTNAVEAAIKLARKVTGRKNIIAFTNGFHGCSLGALSLTGNSFHRNSSVTSLDGVSRMPYDGYFGTKIVTTEIIEKMLSDKSSGIDKPAAIILETIQGEGGLNCATYDWVRRLSEIAKNNDTLLIIDEVQTGCGRSGKFFSFEDFNIIPDIIVMAKSLSGYGLPLALILMRKKYDVWDPGEHNGTFRGNNHAFVTASETIKEFWKDNLFQDQVECKSVFLYKKLSEIASNYQFKIKGRGLIQGINFFNGDLCSSIISECYKNGLIIESCGPSGEILKLLPPLTISMEDLNKGLSIIKKSVERIKSKDTEKLRFQGFEFVSDIKTTFYK